MLESNTNDISNIAQLKPLALRLNYLYLIVSISLAFFSPFLFIIFVSLLSPFIERKLVYFLSPLVLVFSICFYASLQPFSDLAEYMNVYHQINNGVIDVFGYERFGYGIEFVILVIMKIAGLISNNNDQFFIFTIYSIIFSLLYTIALKVDKKFHLIIFYAFFASLGLIESLSYFLRQNLSVLFFLYGVLCTRNKKVRYVCFALSFFSHFSAIINLFVYLFAVKYARRIDTPKRIANVAILVSVTVILTVLFLLYTTAGNILFDKIEYVINNSQYSPLPLPYVIFTLFNTLFVLIFSYRYRQDNIVLYYLMIKEILFFFLTLPFPAVPNRLGMIIFSYSYLFLLPLYTLSLTYRKKYLISSCYIIMNAIPFLYSMYIVSGKGNDLTFYMNKPFTINSYELVEGFYDNFKNGVNYIDGGNTL